MNHTKEQAIEIAKEYKKKHSNLENKIANAVFNEQFDQDETTTMEVSPESYALLQSIKGPLYVVSVIGPLNSGKSVISTIIHLFLFSS